jgi:hypothetical protein
MYSLLKNHKVDQFMKIKYFQVFLVGFLVIPLIIFLFIDVPRGQAQSSQIWSTPINLSNAGSSTSPEFVIDAEGVFHVIWIDEFDGYKYVNSVDGVEWTTPITVRFPFSPEDDSSPVLLADKNGGTHAFWINNRTNALYYSNLSSGRDFKSGWTGRSRLADSVLDFKVVISSQGIVHVGYVTSLGTDINPAGVYYLQINAAKRSSAKNLYPSPYFRSLGSDSANVRIVVSEENELETVYLVWDDRPQKRILIAKSLDGGESWEEASQILGPEDLAGTTTPFNVNIAVLNDEVLLTWQSGIPGEQCTQYSAWSTDGGKGFEEPQKISDQFMLCPQAVEFVLSNKEFSVVLFNTLDEISLMAWDGSVWSEPQLQSQIVAFLNPVTLESVILGCQEATFYNTTLYVVGCDKGNGGDIWFSARSLGTLEDWFPPSSMWSAATEVTIVDQKIPALSSVTDSQNNVHTFWAETPFTVASAGKSTIRYARWNGEAWSSPVTIVSRLDGIPLQLNVNSDSLSRVLLAWVDGKTGDMFLSWANADRANIASEWNAPQFIPSVSQANSSPDILVDASGRILVAYAISINEPRGIYLVESDNGGMTWTQPLRAFDAASAGWEMVDEPAISLTGDGRLHLLFKRYSLQGEQRRSLGVFYSRSADGGATWSAPEAVSERPVSWSQIVGYDRSTVHRLWQVSDEAVLVSFHQVSLDGGATWSSPATVSSLSARSSLNEGTIDAAGNLYFLQLTSNGYINLLDHRWNGSGWSAEQPKELYNKDPVVPSSITANITSTGNLLVSILVDYPNLTGEIKNEILSIGKSLELPEVLQTPYAVIFPDVEPTTIVDGETSATLQSPTPDAPLASSNNSPSFLSRNKNLIGFLLLGVILAFIAVMFWPVSKRQR